MNVSNVFIRRPVFTTMLVLAPVVLGVLSYTRLPVELFPSVDFPVVTVTTALPGASVEEVEAGITRPLEEAINTVSNIDELNSVTAEGLSQITVSFALEKGGSVAAQEVRDKVATVIATLPPGTQSPIIDRLDFGSAPIMTVAVSGRRSLAEMSQLADRQIRPRLEGLDGVGRVALAGARLRAINVIVDATKLEAYSLSIEQVRQALLAQNIEIPGGRVDQPGRELVLRTVGRIAEVERFAQIIVAVRAGYPIRVGDVGRVEDGVVEPRSLSRLDGENSVTIVVQRQSDANVVDVIADVKARLEELRQTLPPDVVLRVISDQSVFVASSLHEVKKHLVIGAVLVALTILLFLRDWRTTLMAGVSIPISIVSTFTFMSLFGFTINTITLLSLVLSAAIVIDDAIVVHENIFRWMEERGFRAREAARGATQEIALAVLATTLSLVVIFLPVAFMSGIVGRFFRSFGITIAVAVLLSLCISFTLTPMLCARFLKAPSGGGHHSRGGVYQWLCERPYMALLRAALRRRWVVVVFSVLIVASTPALFAVVGKNFVPKDDQSEFEIGVTAPEGWTLDRLSRELMRVEGRLRELRGVQNIVVTIGDVTGRAGKGGGNVTKATVYVRIAPFDQRIQSAFDRMFSLGPGWLARLFGARELDPELRGLSQFDVMRQAREQLRLFPDLRTAVQAASIVGGGRGVRSDVQFHLVGPDVAVLARKSQELLARMRALPGIQDADTTLALRKPELRVVVRREKAMDLGVPVNVLASTLQTLVGGQIVTSYKDEADGEQYDVWLRAEPGDRDDPTTVERLTVPSIQGGLVRVGNLASLEEARGPSQIDRLNRQRKVTLVCNLDGLSIGAAVAEIQKVVDEVGLPPGYAAVFTGSAKTLAETGVAFAVAFVLSFVFMYMILAAQFESFVHPLTILVSLPLTIPFALISLLLLGQSLDIYSAFGLFLLFGIVKKNGILVVDYTNTLRARGVPRDQAVLEANQTRLRPILMTTVMLIAGMIPIALGVGPGTGSRASIAMVVIGGQSLSLILSLLVTPVAYTYSDDLLTRLGFRGEPPEEDPSDDLRVAPVASAAQLGAEA